MSAPFAFLYRSHAWNSGLDAFWAVVILWVVSPSCRLRTSTATRSVGLKLSRMHSDADGSGHVGFAVAFMVAPRGPGSFGGTRPRPTPVPSTRFHPPPTQQPPRLALSS